jgi:predicted Rossmann fold nucleotide-binding protein DprA/Smf involved in DNA uptake
VGPGIEGIEMTTSPQTQAILLATAHLGKAAPGDPRPLTPAEWGRFALWLKHQGLLPEALLAGDPATVLAGWEDPAVTPDRLKALLGRGAALALVMERWQRAGLWVLTRSDPAYPDRLKKHLKTDSPPVLFGCGHRALLNRGGIAVVGSRAASDDDLAFATRSAGQAAAKGATIVSGGARGIDEAAMLGALQAGGTAVGVLADSLLRAATSAKYRKGLMSNDLALISPFNPEAGFDVGNAMARNRYVYCLADAAIVVCSTRDKGGTWNGAVENLRHGWVPLWVQPSEESGSGNGELVRLGARRLPADGLDPAALAAGHPPYRI